MKLRYEKNCRGSSGSSVFSSTRTNPYTSTALSTIAPQIHGEFRPNSPTWPSANIRQPALTARRKDPRTSKRTFSRVVSTSTNQAKTSASTENTPWTMKSMRQPMYWTIGPPAIRPNAGAPAPIIDHQPMARVRSSGLYASKINAMELGPEAAPMTEAATRNPINE